MERWKSQLRGAPLSKVILEPQRLVDYEAYSDASSGFGVAIMIGPRWRAWRLAAGWKSQGRDIQWAEAVGFELLTIHICILSKEGEHIKVHGDNRGVVEGWWKGCSGNRPTNSVFRRIHKLSGDCNRFIHTRYIPSEQNPADAPSRGQYPPTALLIHGPPTPTELRPFLIDTHPN